MNFNKHVLFVTAIAACLLYQHVPCNAADIVIAKGSGKTSVDLSGLQVGNDQASREFLMVLQTDLSRSGWLERGRPESSDYAVEGIAKFDGASIRANIQVTQKSSRRVLMNKPYNGDASSLRRVAHGASDDILYAITGKKGFASAKLLMVGNRTKNKELYISDSDGKGLYQLTANKSPSIAPRWSPDARSVYFTSYLRTFAALYKLDLDSRKISRISNFAGLNTGGAVSPDGKEVALILSRDGNPDLYVMRLSDGTVTRVTRTPASEASPCWSPDGSQLVYVSDQSYNPNLFVVSRNGGSPRQITKVGRQNAAPDWGPNGQIAFASLIGGKFQICLVDANTGNIRQLTSEYADHEDPTWAPDGRHLAIAKSVQYNSGVYLIDTMGDASILLTDYQGDWYSPKWSP